MDGHFDEEVENGYDWLARFPAGSAEKELAAVQKYMTHFRTGPPSLHWHHPC